MARRGAAVAGIGGVSTPSAVSDGAAACTIAPKRHPSVCFPSVS
ncbi:hypothetical protein [Kingella potus]|nr:hypothetical protein [Kingella potus]